MKKESESEMNSNKETELAVLNERAEALDGGHDRLVDDETLALRLYVREWRDIQQNRLAAEQRGLDDIATELHRVEDGTAKVIIRLLKQHPIYPWLKPGLRGVQMARFLSEIGDPRRFPGQRCSKGHYLAAIHGIGDPCPRAIWNIKGEDSQLPQPTLPEGEQVPCPGTLLAPRSLGNGTRSLWHYAGLHTVNGKAPRKTRGKRCDWNLSARTALLMPDVGVAAQIVRHRVDPYREVYDSMKERKLAEGLPPYKAEQIARTRAVKVLVADLLQEWKRLAA